MPPPSGIAPSYHPTLPPSKSSQRTKPRSLFFTAGSHQLSVLHMGVYVCQSSLPVCPTLLLPHWAHMAIIYVCVSITALKIGSKNLNVKLDNIKKKKNLQEKIIGRAL